MAGVRVPESDSLSTSVTDEAEGGTRASLLTYCWIWETACNVRSVQKWKHTWWTASKEDRQHLFAHTVFEFSTWISLLGISWRRYLSQNREKGRSRVLMLSQTTTDNKSDPVKASERKVATAKTNSLWYSLNYSVFKIFKKILLCLTRIDFNQL